MHPHPHTQNRCTAVALDFVITLGNQVIVVGSPGQEVNQRRGPQPGKMGRVEVDRGWRFVSICYEGQQTDVAGVNPWEVQWTSTGSRITVAHPQYPSQRHNMVIYEVTGSMPPIRFAAGEFSNGVWGFFVPAVPEA